jgi:hypothetical protein
MRPGRLQIYNEGGWQFRGTLPTDGLSFSLAVGGAGDLSFTASETVATSLGAYDCVAILEIEYSPGTWTPVPQPYAIRTPIKRARIGNGRVSLVGTVIQTAWASETVIYPEYVVDVMEQTALDQRGLGWMSTAYDPTDDPREPWDLVTEPGRATRPTDWPGGTGAQWITCSNFTDLSERKLFRSTVTIPEGGRKGIRFYFSSDESATLWFAGEQVIVTNSQEIGYKDTHKADIYAFSGTYAIAIDAVSVVTADAPGAGSGADPVICAVALLDDQSEASTWLNVTNDTDWVATRRDDTGANSEPPGPTPGALIMMLVDEAIERSTSGWPNISYSFTKDVDSNGAPWTIASERMMRYAFDTYTQVFEALAETDTDVWITNDLTMHAAAQQGDPAVKFDAPLNEVNIITMSDQTTADAGNLVVALTLDGWVQKPDASPSFRREFGLELGQAISKQMGWRICESALADDGRWDGTVKFKIVPGLAIPFVNFTVGDTIPLAYRGVNRNVRVLSIAAQATEGGFDWSLELTEPGI